VTTEVVAIGLPSFWTFVAASATEIARIAVFA
jgi:hypothetical protein